MMLYIMLLVKLATIISSKAACYFNYNHKLVAISKLLVVL
jgi:hypothetical protein